MLQNKREKEAKKTQQPNAKIAKSAFTLKQAHTLEEEVQETTATERQDRQKSLSHYQNTMYFAFQQT